VCAARCALRGMGNLSCGDRCDPKGAHSSRTYPIGKLFLSESLQFFRQVLPTPGGAEKCGLNDALRQEP
jgi:hypothetical protein